VAGTSFCRHKKPTKTQPREKRAKRWLDNIAEDFERRGWGM